MTWLEKLLLIWLTGSVVLAIGIARVLKGPDVASEADFIHTYGPVEECPRCQKDAAWN